MATYILHGLYSNRSFETQSTGAVSYDGRFMIKSYGSGEFYTNNVVVEEQLTAYLKKACRPYSASSLIDHKNTNNPRNRLRNIMITTNYKEIISVNLVRENWPEQEITKPSKTAYKSLEHFGLF